ncbi:MAG: cyclase family protein [Bryobacteraceae bacterium]
METSFTRGETTAAADAIALGTHFGTHIDALSHFSRGGISSATAAWSIRTSTE